MTRSNNSRKGKHRRPYECECCKYCSDRTNNMKSKRREKLIKKDLKFYDKIYTYKNKGSKLKHNFKSSGRWDQDRVDEGKLSYQTWSWLKGKPNKKGMNHKILRGGFCSNKWLS